MRDGEFEWDDDKAAANLAKHKVSFSAARQAFADAFAVEREDDTKGYDEPRFNLLGMVDGKVLFVAYTMRGEHHPNHFCP
jgi:uncharacterized protein